MSQCIHDWKILLKTHDEAFMTTSILLSCPKCGVTLKYQLDGKEVSS